jgi:hypothetical protein
MAISRKVHRRLRSIRLLSIAGWSGTSTFMHGVKTGRCLQID